MKVILRKDVTTLGNIGEIVTVKDGYGRNYLIPRNLAYYATPGAMKTLEIEKKQNAKRLAKERSSSEALALELADKQVSIAMKVGEEGKLYGSVTPAMIAQELTMFGFDIDKRLIHIEEPIRSLGVFDVKVKLHPDISATVKVWVISEE